MKNTKEPIKKKVSIFFYFPYKEEESIEQEEVRAGRQYLFKGDVENPIHNTLSITISDISSAYKRPTGVCLLP